MNLPHPDAQENQARYEIVSLFRGSLLSYLVGFYLFAFYLELHFRIPALQTIRFQFTYGALLGAMCLFKFFTDTKKPAGLNSVTKTALLLIFILGIYTIFSMDRTESWRVFNDRVVKFALVAFFIYAGTNKVEDLRVIVAFMLLAWLKIGQEGFWGWLGGGLVWENQGIPRLHGSTAMLGHPNSFSGFAVGCLPFAIFLLMSLKNRLLQLGLLALIGCCLVIVVTTGSRTGYVATLLGAIYFFLKLKTGKLKLILFGIFSLALLVNIIPDDYKGRFMSIFTGQEKEGHSSETRKQIIEDALALYAKYPLGVGVQAFPKVREELFGRVQNTHNLYLEILTNVGPFGVLVFFVFIMQMFRLNISNIKNSQTSDFSDPDKRFMFFLSKAIIGFLIVRLLLGLFGMDLYEIYWWVSLGITLAIAKLIYIGSAQK